jgi:hypothetical protein
MGERGPNQAHITADDVVELRQLIERVLAQTSAEVGDPRIVGDLEQDAVALVLMGETGAELVGVCDHGAELVALEGAALPANAFGNVEDGARRVDPDRDDGQDRREGK